MSDEPVPETKPPRPRWLTATKTVFDLPNPRIFKLFLVSSTATLSLGIALVVEWALHGKHHSGFHWIIYYASSLISLPILIWVGLLFSAYSLHRSTLLDPTAGEETRPAQDQLALVQSSNVSEFRGTEATGKNLCRSLVVASDEKKKSNAEKMPRLKRTVSLPLPGKATHHRTISKRMSLRLF